MKRSSFIKRILLSTGSVYLLPLSSQLIETEEGKQDNINTDIVYVEGVDGYIKCFQARPETDKRLGCLILIHDNKGLNKFYMNLAKRTASYGFHVLVPDALSPLGGTLGELSENRNAIKKLDQSRVIENYRRTIVYLQKLEGDGSKVGVIGFGWGGTQVHNLCLESPNIEAAVSYFGAPPKGNLAKLNVPLMIHQSQTDQTLKSKKGQFKIALEENAKNYQWIEHEGTKRNFHNENNRENFNKKASEVAWSQSLRFLNKNLK